MVNELQTAEKRVRLVPRKTQVTETGHDI